ncbi:MAG: hypothetical protein IKT41_00550 [Clostridia bacterium]|nr:hypothetical protein [Clostridia bacterium]
MIEITQKEFENKVRDIIEGKTTREKLLKELKIDRITLNNKIQELVVYNPELHLEFIEKFPYKPREYTHINWRAMLIDIMKKGYTKHQAAEQYEISHRTIARKVYEVEDEYIVNLYREVAGYRKRQKPLPSELQEIVDALPAEEVFIGGIYDKKLEELNKLGEDYYDQLAKGENTRVASANCGKSRVTKDLNTLYRIKIEQNTLSQRTNLDESKGKEDSGEER